MLDIPKDWLAEVEKHLPKDYLANLEVFIDTIYKADNCTPRREDLFRALRLTPFDSVRVVILGQDPYPNPAFACGLAFSVRKGVKIPMSLRNIYKVACGERAKEQDGDLTHWAQQGVLLLNTALTFVASQNHYKIWQPFTDAIVTAVSQATQKKIFMLWGAHAIKKSDLINEHHLILKSVHPSPLSARGGFFNCDHFNIANTILNPKIEWSKLSQETLF